MATDHRRDPDGCFWVSFALTIIGGLACVGLLGALAFAAIGWLERH